MSAVTARRLVMSALVWVILAAVAGTVFLAFGFSEENGWLFDVVDIAVLSGCNAMAVKVWKWSKP